MKGSDEPVRMRISIGTVVMIMVFMSMVLMMSVVMMMMMSMMVIVTVMISPMTMRMKEMRRKIYRQQLEHRQISGKRILSLSGTLSPEALSPTYPRPGGLPTARGQHWGRPVGYGDQTGSEGMSG